MKEDGYLTQGEFMSTVDKYIGSYWRHKDKLRRWEYHAKSIGLLQSIDYDTLLEAGTMGVKVHKDSDTIEYHIPELKFDLYFKPTYNADLKELPWCIGDKQYDVFLSLRVFHHLGDKPKEYFKEMQRISNHIILAIPRNMAEIYKLISKPDKEIRCRRGDTLILYYHVS